MMPATHDTNEPRQQAIWPWVLMPVVVLLVAFTLERIKDAAQAAGGVPDAAAPAQIHSTTTTSGTTEP